MQNSEIKIIKVISSAVMPKFMTRGAACMDIAIPDDRLYRIPPHWVKKIRTGLRIEIPSGYHAKLYPRSSLMIKKSLIMPVGIIDCDYKDEIHIIVYNAGLETAVLEGGERVMQMEFCKNGPVPEGIEIMNVERTGGFGSTDRSEK